jgi:hypothetical protein
LKNIKDSYLIDRAVYLMKNYSINVSCRPVEQEIIDFIDLCANPVMSNVKLVKVLWERSYIRNLPA